MDIEPATTSPAPGSRDLKEVVAGGLEEARRRSLGLLEPIPDPDLVRQHSPIMSPLVWDLAHVGNYEEIWLLESVAGLRAGRANYDDLYDAFRHARADRPGLPLLGPAHRPQKPAKRLDRFLHQSSLPQIRM